MGWGRSLRDVAGLHIARGCWADVCFFYMRTLDKHFVVQVAEFSAEFVHSGCQRRVIVVAVVCAIAAEQHGERRDIAHALF